VLGAGPLPRETLPYSHGARDCTTDEEHHAMLAYRAPPRGRPTGSGLGGAHV